jgi:uncharacterized membrane protein YebE (DUF533 family)
LSLELFQSLLAIGWIDGELAESERDAILAAARQSGLAAADLAKLEAMAGSPVTFSDMDFTPLSAEQRLFVYAVASWVAKVDDIVTGDERAALHAIGTLLGITGTGRRRMDETVDQLRRAADKPQRLDLEGLRARVDDTIREVAAS